MKKNKIIIAVFIIFAFLSISVVQAEEVEENITLEQVGESFGLDSYLSEVQNCMKDYGVENININDISKDLLNGVGFDYKNIFSVIVSSFAREVLVALKGAVFIFVIIIIMSIMSQMELDKGSHIVEITNLICFIAIASILTITFKDVIVMFKNTSDVLSKIMQIVSPFLIAILIGTGAITTTGIIQPLLLFISSLIGFIVTYVVVPFISVSIALNIISTISDNLRFSDMSKLFNKCSLWLVGIVLTLFLGILGLETSLSSTVDSLTVNVTQAAVSNFIPVVGKFFSDSFETVIGATKIIGKTGGIVGIITIILISSIPLLKITAIMVVYMLIASVSQIICSNEKITKFINGYAEVYRTLLGVLIGIDILFIISTGIILNLCSKIVT